MQNYIVLPKIIQTEYISRELTNNKKAIHLCNSNHNEIQSKLNDNAKAYEGFTFYVKDTDIWYRDFTKETWQLINTIMIVLFRWRIYGVQVIVVSSADKKNNLIDIIRTVSKPIRNLLDGAYKEVK